MCVYMCVFARIALVSVCVRRHGIPVAWQVLTRWFSRMQQTRGQICKITRRYCVGSLWYYRFNFFFCWLELSHFTSSFLVWISRGFGFEWWFRKTWWKYERAWMWNEYIVILWRECIGCKMVACDRMYFSALRVNIMYYLDRKYTKIETHFLLVSVTLRLGE